ncbi:MAG: hypothetical protein UU08_C0006G0019 [Candidatus Uhrbacteria bacterium GW2011_GWE2_40_58]|nr:MAG: hypothetical protein UT94_C0007G0030 [Candidatus Uhrbacteria bacterium GW2011_GWF2_40_263]KKR67901.1 MAG: hypothetical protein UU08_C0006G0019 [Candidatus Uhrbacteria bacterium GW2011_GWE2_40_58]OGL92501.1 MAG: hypothetical protein A2239_01665 [Candidatus Uhrbacteria bacterium RIFOXYA2_FULL_40_9]OGL96870.1 MAG: hypothetical protein A2332_02000 [Candidatus Uhrbacteria bacterium RIFOXYB2_FULL_41_18]HBK34534.1 hypothetical protein [Candidatus Uhrbacteria bacterium]
MRCEFLFVMQNMNRGQSLVEVILVVALFAVIAVSVITVLLSSIQMTKQGVEYVAAAGYIKEGIEAVRSIRDRDWAEVTNGTHGLTTTSGYYEFLGTANTIDTVYTRTITIEDVYRMGSLNGDIAPSGVLDANTKKVTINVTWDTLEDKTQNIDSVFYVMNWGILSWTQTTSTEFDAGRENSTDITASGNGEVTLRSNTSDWSGLLSHYQINLDGSGDRIAMQYVPEEDILYVLSLGTSGYEFVALDVSDVSESTPTVLRGMEIADVSDDFVVHNGYAYIANNNDSGEVKVINTTTMTQVNTIDLSGTEDATGVAAYGNKLVVVRGIASTQELFVYNISTPSSMITQLGVTELGVTTTDVGMDSAYAYVGTTHDTKELVVVRLSDFTQVNTLDLIGLDDVTRLIRSGTNLYIGRVNGTAYDAARVSVASPEGALSVAQSIEVGATVNDLSVDPHEESLMLATTHDTKEAIVVNISTFVESASFDVTTTDDAKSVAVYGAEIYLGMTTDAADLSILRTQTTSWNTAQLIGFADKPGTHDGSHIEVVENFTYVTTTNGANEFFIYDTSTPSTPVLLGSLEMSASAMDLQVVGDYAYIATDNKNTELVVIDIRTKTSPVVIGSYDAPGSADGHGILVSGNYAYLGTTSSKNPELYILDISIPSTPTLVGSYNYSADINHFALSGNYLFAATANNSQELAVFNIATPSAPTLVGGYDTLGNADAVTITFSGTLVALGHVSSPNEELILLNVTTPSVPIFLSGTEIGGNVNSIFLDGTSIVYLATNVTNQEFQRWDISTPTSPVRTTTFDLDDEGMGVFYNGTYVFLATRHNSMELQILGPSTVLEYAPEGTFTSQAFDSGSSSTTWDTIEWTKSGIGDIVFRMRTASSETNLVSAKWVGFDGTANTTYSISGQNIVIDPSATGTQWVQWKAYLSGNRITTPILEDVSIVY